MPDEGRTFENPDHAIALHKGVERFLAEHLAGEGGPKDG